MSVVGKRRKVVLGPRLAGTLMTPEEFDAVERYNENYRYELIHGVLVVSPLPLAQETGPNELLGNLLFVYHEQNPQGTALDCTLPEQYIATADSRRRADRVIWVGLGRLPDLERDLPTIVVEFVSKAKRDRDRDYIEKRAEYLALGIPEYWIVDRFRRTLTVCRPAAEDRVVKEGETYQPPRLPGFELPLARLLVAADAWDRRKTS
jgi:Uma2 family endonuclease